MAGEPVLKTRAVSSTRGNGDENVPVSGVRSIAWSGIVMTRAVVYAFTSIVSVLAGVPVLKTTAVSSTTGRGLPVAGVLIRTSPPDPSVSRIFPDAATPLPRFWTVISSAPPSEWLAAWVDAARLSIWVWMAEVTPSRYPNSVEVTTETTMSPDESVTTARLAVPRATATDSIVAKETLPSTGLAPTS